MVLFFLAVVDRAKHGVFHLFRTEAVDLLWMPLNRSDNWLAGEDLRGELRMQSMSAFISSHRTGPPPISPGKRKYSGDQLNDNVESEHVSKMSRLFAAQM